MSVCRLIVVSFALIFAACEDKNGVAVAIETEDEKILYALGQGLARQFTMVGLFDDAEMAFISQGFVDAVANRDSLVAFKEYVDKMNAVLTARRGEKNLQWGNEFRERAAGWEGAITTPSGLIYQVVQDGTGPHPSETDTVMVNYNGRFIDGRVFDSSAKREDPAVFSLDRVIPGWTEGLQLMKVGGKARFVIPPHLAYGSQGSLPAISPNATLIFEIELMTIK